MKKTVFLFTFLAGMEITGLHGQIIKKTGSFSLTVEPALTFASEKITENIYYSAPNEDKKISMLEWENRVLMYGISVLSQYKKAKLNFSIYSSNDFLHRGIMTDSDWDNMDNFEMKTNLSKGDSMLNSCLDTNLSFQLDFNAAETVKISPAVSVNYNKKSFSRKNAEGWYGSKKYTTDGQYHWWYDDEAAKYPYYNETTGKRYRLAPIDLYTTDFAAEAGIKACFKITDRTVLGFYAGTTVFTYFYGIDTHWTQDGSTKELYPMRYKYEYFNFFEKVNADIFMNIQLTDIFEVAADLCINTTANQIKKKTKGTFTSDLDKFYTSNQDFSIFKENLYLKIALKINII